MGQIAFVGIYRWIVFVAILVSVDAVGKIFVVVFAEDTIWEEEVQAFFASLLALD